MEFDHVPTQNTLRLIGQGKLMQMPSLLPAHNCSILGRPVHLKQQRPGAGRWDFPQVGSMRIPH